MEQKRCGRCKEVKQLDKFCRNKRTNDGRNNRCKACVSCEKKRAYQPKRKPAPENIPDGMKWCRKCDTVQPVECFHRKSRTLLRKNGSLMNTDPYATQCKTCDRENQLLHHYGITQAEYDAKLQEQDGRCAICRRHDPGFPGVFHIDHCHNSNCIRDLLCVDCNRGLGCFKDDPELLDAAVSYLQRHRLRETLGGDRLAVS